MGATHPVSALAAALLVACSAASPAIDSATPDATACEAELTGDVEQGWEICLTCRLSRLARYDGAGLLAVCELSGVESAAALLDAFPDHVHAWDATGCWESVDESVLWASSPLLDIPDDEWLDAYMSAGEAERATLDLIAQADELTAEQLRRLNAIVEPTEPLSEVW